MALHPRKPRGPGHAPGAWLPFSSSTPCWQAHASASPADKLAIERLFSAITLYGGGIGELLGVSLLMAASMAAFCAGAWAQRRMPTWLALLGLVTAVALAGMAAPALGLSMGVPTAAAVSLLSAWMLAAGMREAVRQPYPRPLAVEADEGVSR